MTTQQSELCPNCGGRGVIPDSSHDSVCDITCPKCEGEGWLWDDMYMELDNELHREEFYIDEITYTPDDN